jgi:hypothetical protein
MPDHKIFYSYLTNAPLLAYQWKRCYNTFFQQVTSVNQLNDLSDYHSFYTFIRQCKERTMHCSVSAFKKKIIMPANLNAMVRYKTINDCLYGGKRKYSIYQLIERCSNALSFHTGRGETLSERTVREDIRVMRGDILGFNAPIKQKDGLYYYDDPYYSINAVNFENSELIGKIIGVLFKVRRQVENPELDQLLEKLSALSGKPLTQWDLSDETFESSLSSGLQSFRIKMPSAPRPKRDTMKEPKPVKRKPVKRKPVERKPASQKSVAALSGMPLWGEILKFL